MKLLIVFLITVTFASCRKGAESKEVDYVRYTYLQKEFLNDTTFVEVFYKNNSKAQLRNPTVDFKVKDTSQNKKLISFSDINVQEKFKDVAPKTNFSVLIPLGSNIDFDNIGKLKFKLRWTNSKGKKSYLITRIN